MAPHCHKLLAVVVQRHNGHWNRLDNTLQHPLEGSMVVLSQHNLLRPKCRSLQLGILHICAQVYDMA